VTKTTINCLSTLKYTSKKLKFKVRAIKLITQSTLQLTCNFFYKYVEIANNSKSTLIIFKFSTSENHVSTLIFPLGPFSKYMDKYNFLDFKSYKIGKLCSKLGNQVKFTSFTLPLVIYICL